MIYLVKGTVTSTPYMADASTEEAIFRLVEAENSTVAEHIFVSYFEGRSDPYGTSIRASVDEVSRMLTKEDIVC